MGLGSEHIHPVPEAVALTIKLTVKGINGLPKLRKVDSERARAEGKGQLWKGTQGLLCPELPLGERREEAKEMRKR